MDIREREQALGQRLVEKQVIDAVQLRSAMAWVHQWGGRITRGLFELRLGAEPKVVETVAQFSGCQSVDLTKTIIHPDAVSLLDPAFCAAKAVLPFAVKPSAKMLAVAMAEPFDKDLIADIAKRAQLSVVAVAAGEGQIQTALAKEAEKLGQHQYGVPTPTAAEEASDDFKLVDGRGKTLNIAKPDLTSPEAMASLDLDMERAPERLRSEASQLSRPPPSAPAAAPRAAAPSAPRPPAASAPQPHSGASGVRPAYKPPPSAPPAAPLPPARPLLAPADLLVAFKVGAWSDDTDLNEFVRSNISAAPADLRKLLDFTMTKHSSADGSAHRRRCNAVAGLVTGKKDPALLGAVVKALREGDAVLRAALVKPLSLTDDVTTLDAVVPLLGSPDPTTRKLAVNIFSTLRSPAHLHAVPGLFKDRNFVGRSEALEVLVRGMGHHALALLTTELPATKPADRIAALKAMGDPKLMARDYAGALALLQHQVGDSSEEVARTALQSYCELCTEEQWFANIGPLTNHPILARTAIEGLKRFSSPRVFAMLEHRLRAGPNPVRLAVLNVLEFVGNNDVLGVLVEALGHKQLMVRTRAGEVLSSLSRAEKIDLSRTIIWLLRSPDVNVRRMAAGLVSSVRGPTEELWPKLLAVLRDEDWWVRERLADVLVQMAGVALTPHIAPYLKEPSEVVRRWAVELLGRLKAPQSLGALVHAAQQDVDWWVRERAILTIGELSDPRAVPYLIDLVQRVPDDQAACLEALLALKAKEGLPHAQTLLSSPSSQVRLAALKLVGELGDASMVPLVQGLVLDADVDVRASARTIAEKLNATPLSIEVAAANVTMLDQLLTKCADLQGDDLFLAPNRVVYIKKLGRVHPMTNNAMNEEQVRALLGPLLTPERAKTLADGEDVDFSYELRTKALRYRVNLFNEANGPAAVFRVIKGTLPSAEAIGLPQQVLQLAQLPRGLVLIGGPTGSGKSTTLSVLIDHINRTEGTHIICLEDPIEYVHADKKSIVTQRELGAHTKSMNNALRATLREDPDVILMGELRDLPSIAFAVTAAETGHLVFGTVHTVAADTSIDRLINSFPMTQQQQVRSMLAESLRAVVCQYLVHDVKTGGRALAMELMLNNDAISSLIRKGKTHQLQSVISTCQAEGMRLMDNDLMRLLKAGRISADEAFMKARSKKDFEAFIAGNDPSKPEAAKAAKKS